MVLFIEKSKTKKIYRMKWLHLSAKVQPLTFQTARVDIGAWTIAAVTSDMNNSSRGCDNGKYGKKAQGLEIEIKDEEAEEQDEI